MGAGAAGLPSRPSSSGRAGAAAGPQALARPARLRLRTMSVGPGPSCPWASSSAGCPGSWRPGPSLRCGGWSRARPLYRWIQRGLRARGRLRGKFQAWPPAGSVWVLPRLSRGRSDRLCPAPSETSRLDSWCGCKIPRRAPEALGRWAMPGSSLLQFVSSLGDGGWRGWTRGPQSRTPQGECFWREGKGARVPARPGRKGAPGDGERLLIRCDWCTR